MKKSMIVLILISVLAVLMLNAGCSISQKLKGEASTEEDATQESSKVETVSADNVASEETTKTTTVKPDSSITEKGRVQVTTQETSDMTTFKKLGDNTRQKSTVEKCELEYPLKCVKYQAKDGIVYLTIKNDGVQSKIDQVTLKLDGQECDPASTYIETTQVKEFQCFVDASEDYASGPLEMSYYARILQGSFVKKGSINVMME